MLIKTVWVSLINLSSLKIDPRKPKFRKFTLYGQNLVSSSFIKRSQIRKGYQSIISEDGSDTSKSKISFDFDPLKTGVRLFLYCIVKFTTDIWFSDVLNEVAKV